ncbi:xyloglucan endotransglucosylase/hydrolase protein 22-like [Humulus lupulus]|uniref:xyloglucan endotransglucosylase/hydrolase protein 22-like n=1 Tax=Humulus lupulus TaxID=3486 RepID=UPI002B41137F|nr:xyloglucan endotransglucosylase/hydrolase protein 22-like [Humulus lupulus]
MAIALLLLLLPDLFTAVVSTGNFSQDFDLTWGDGRGQILDGGDLLTLSLDNISGSGFRSKKEYLFGNINMQLKLVPGNSSGTVITYYLASNKSTLWDEIDFAFVGNLSGEPYVVHTNVLTQGKGDKVQQFYLWFDPTQDFHTYSFLWNPLRIIFAVDGSPIRVFKNLESSMGVPYPRSQPMRIYSTLCSAKELVTDGGGGFVETDWSKAPFNASYRNFDDKESCVWWSGASSCNSTTAATSPWLSDQLDSASQERLRWIQSNYMIYNYCSDVQRFPDGLPPECDVV